MKNKLTVVLVVALFKGIVLFSQEKVIFFDSSEISSHLLSEVKTNSRGELCLKMKNDGIKFLMYLDNNSTPIVSSYNKTYTVKGFIRIVSKGGINIKISKDSSNANHWIVEKKERTPIRKELKRYKGVFKFEKGTTFKSLKKEEYNHLFNDKL